MRAIAQERAVSTGRSQRWSRFKAFFRDAWIELQKVIWPSQQEVIKMTGLVIAVVVIIGLFIFLWDQILVVITRPLLG